MSRPLNVYFANPTKLYYIESLPPQWYMDWWHLQMHEKQESGLPQPENDGLEWQHTKFEM